MEILRKYLFAAAVIQLFYIQDAVATDCNKIVDFHPVGCCKLPKLVVSEREKMETSMRELVKGEVTDSLGECKATEMVFKELKFVKDDDINEEEINKVIDSLVEDAEWKPILKSAVKECKQKVNAKIGDVQKKMEAAPFNIKKDQCNVRYSSLTTCFIVEAFGKCPASQWTDNKQCAAGKEWFKDCGNSVDSFFELFGKKP